MKLEPEVADLANKMRQHFLVPFATEDLFATFQKLSGSINQNYQPALKAFHHSLSATISTVTLPFELASAGTEQRHFQRLHIAERIRAQGIPVDAVSAGDDLEAYRENHARTKARERMRDFSKSTDGVNLMTHDICAFLMEGLNHGLEHAAKELLQQGLVLLWSAFEVLFRDTFEALLNETPAKAQALITHPKTRKRFEAEKLPIDTLARHGFDLSSRLGSVLVAQQDFSSLPTIKSVYSVLFPSNQMLNQALDERELWVLFQRRHLIVHRRGVIDQTYLDATGEDSPPGSKLYVTPNDFETPFRMVVAAGEALASSLPCDATQQLVGPEP